MSLMSLMSRSAEKTRPREDRRKTPARLYRSPFLASPRELLASGCMHYSCDHIHRTLMLRSDAPRPTSG